MWNSCRGEKKCLSLNIGCAFLNACGEDILVRLDETNSEVLCQLRPDYWKYIRKESIVILDKALYGWFRSARFLYFLCIWFRCKSVFNKTSAEEVQCTVYFHVDGVLRILKIQSMLDEFKNVCLNKYENVSITEGKILVDYLTSPRKESARVLCRVVLINYQKVGKLREWLRLRQQRNYLVLENIQNLW